MYKLSEVVKLLGVTPETLVIWNDWGILRPDKISQKDYWFYSKEKVLNMLLKTKRRIAVSWESSDTELLKSCGYKEDEILTAHTGDVDCMMKLLEMIMYGSVDMVTVRNTNVLGIPYNKLIKRICESKDILFIVLEEVGGSG